MLAYRPWATLLALVIGLAVACGGDDDDASNDSDGKAPGFGGGSGASAKDQKSGKVSIAKSKDGNYPSGKVHIEVSGERKDTRDLEGTGFAQSGTLLLAFGSDDATMSLNFASDGNSGPGGFAVTTKDYSTAAEWGDGCDVELKSDGGKVSGSFSCASINAIKVSSGLPEYKVSVKGTFSAAQ
jgi:hypothetical protein